MKKSSLLVRFVGLFVASAAMIVSVKAAPIIISATESAAPGDIITIQGDGFTTTPQVWFHLVKNTDTTLSPDTQVTTILSNTTQAISARLNKNVPFGLYAVWVKDSTGAFSAAPVFINRARPMQYEFAEVPAGYVFRIFGRNLCLPGATPNVTLVSGSNSYTAPVVTTYANDSYVLQVTAPGTLPTSGTFTVNVGNGYGHNSSLTAPFDVASGAQTIVARAGGTDAFALGVPWGADFNNIKNAAQINVVTSTNPHTHVAYGADATGATNSINAIQQAIYDAGNHTLYPNGTVVYIPAGTFLINYSGEATTFVGTSGTNITQPADVEIVVPSNVVIQGAGVTQTTINDATSGLPYPNRAIVNTTGASLFGLLNFTYTQTGAVTTATPPPIISMNGSESFFSNITTNFGYSNGVGCQGGSLGFGGGGSHNILVQNVHLDHAIFSSESQVAAGSNYIIRNNTFLHHGTWYRTRIIVGGLIQNTLYENNHATIDGQWPATTTTGNVYTGTASAGTTTTLTDSTASWTVNAFKNDYIYIASGTGLQQYQQIKSNTATTITFYRAVATAPDSTSTYSIGTGISYPYEQGGIECDNCNYGVFLNNIFDAVNLPLDYQNDYETFNSQGQPMVPNDVGVVSSGTASSITDSARSWVSSSLIGQTLSITSGPGSGESGTVTSNTATTVTVGTTWTTLPTSASHYSVTRNGYDFGTVSTATSTTLTGTSASGNGTAWPTSGTGLAGNIVAIISGPGRGQWRIIASNTINTLTVSTPWAETPTSSSTYSITGGEDQHILYKANTLSDLPRGMALYTGSFDCAVVDNAFYDTGETIYLRSDQRNIQGGGWSGRMNLSWNDVVAGNSGFDTLGTWATTFSAALYQTSGSILAGTIELDPEFRQNIIVSKAANMYDSAIAVREGYSDFCLDSNASFTDMNIPGLLTGVFDDNENMNLNASNTNSPVYLNSDSYNTSLLAQLNLGTFNLTPLPYSDAKITTATHASVATSYTVDPVALTANFDGSGTSTGGSSDMFDFGASGTFVAGTSHGSALTIISTTPFTGTSGAYLEDVRGSGTGGTLPYVNVAPTTDRTSWGRIFDLRSGEWEVNGGYDFFVRPQLVTGSFMRPIDINNGVSSNGLRLTFAALNPSELRTEVITATGGGGLELYAPYPAGFTANQIYHMGVTFSTNPATGVTTEKIFCVPGTGSISTSSTTVGTGGLLAIGTFTLNPGVFYNTGGFLSSGAWAFGDGASGLTVSVVNDYDGFKMYSQDPGTFPGL